jgi:hypothetical protein
MRRLLENVIPIGTPWGGPESVRYLSSFVSLLMEIEGCRGELQARQQMHERLYHLYLVVSGIGVCTAWSGSMEDRSHEAIADRLVPDYIARTMAYAGCLYREVAVDSHTREAIVGSIDRGVPVLARSVAGDWLIVTGYDDGGGTLIGWDGAHTYWGPPAIAPDRSLENGMFATASWPETFSRCVVVEGRTAPQTASRAVIAHLVAVMDEQRSRGYDREFKALLQDDVHCRSVDAEVLRKLWDFTNAFVGWYAENRSHSGAALTDDLSVMPDIAGRLHAVECLGRAEGAMCYTHDLCWEAWRTMFASHPCDLTDDEPCRMCGGCVRRGADEDYEAFREPARRRKLMGYLRSIDANEEKVLAELKACVALL